MAMKRTWMKELRKHYGSRLQENVVMSNYTTWRAGGVVDLLLPVHSGDDLSEAAALLWQMDVPFKVLGSGSNILVSDKGWSGVVLLNRAHNIKIDSQSEEPTVWAETGANLGTVSRQVGLRGLGGMEWASTIPGTLGGAVYGNAGAHGGNMAGCLLMAEILHRTEGRCVWPLEKLGYQYRSSIFKRETQPALILAAQIRLQHSTPEAVKEKMAENSARRRASQPTGPCAGSVFKNPEGDYAGRLIEAAGLKGLVRDGVQISPIHANFFLNEEDAPAARIWELITLARKTVAEHSGVKLELEIELLGEFDRSEW